MTSHVSARLSRRLTVLGLLLVAALAFGACGSDSGSDSNEIDSPPVATFDGEPITRAEFDAWSDASLANARANPEKEFIVVYDPPPYRRCLQGFDAGMTKAERYLGNQIPKNECRLGWKTKMNRIMTELLTARWLEAEARKQGIDVSEDEARTAFSKHLGTKDAERMWGDQRYDDLVENLGEEHVLAQARTFALTRKLVEEGQEPAPSKTYRARTTCAAGFRTLMCSNGPKPPKMPSGPQPAPGAGEVKP